MNLISTRIWTLFLFGVVILPLGWADCPTHEVEQLAFENFERGIPTDWDAPPTSDGDHWQFDPLTFGYYENPGSNNWAYVNDEARNQVGAAMLRSPRWDASAYKAYLQLEFDLNFQEYAGQGVFWLEIWDGQSWIEVYRIREDLIAHVSVDITPYANADLQVRFSYNDEGSWGWGMGLDNVKLVGKTDTCGDGICDFGEEPGSCLDCEALIDPAPSWLGEKQDIQGLEVGYKDFLNGSACDDCSEEIALGFELNFFGKTYESVFLNANGNLTLESPYTSFTPEPFCLEGPKMIAPFFSDVDLTRGGRIRYYQDPQGHYFVAKWELVAFFGADGHNPQRNSFQVILTDGSIRNLGEYLVPLGANVIFSYGNMEWTTGSSSGGVNGFGGSPATVGLNQGDGQSCEDYGIFDREGFAYYGNFQDSVCIGNGVSHLDYRTLSFNAAQGEYVEPTGRIVLKGITGEEGITLVWCTDKLEETQFFVLERIKGEGDAIFEEITMVDKEDPLARQKGEYVYLDKNIQPDTNYYRITRVQTDGTLDFSPVIAVATQADEGGVPGPLAASLGLTGVGPNPFQDHLNVIYELETEASVHYQLVDMSGRPILQGNWAGQQGQNERHLSLPELPRAMYVFSLSNGKEVAHMNLIHQ